MGFKLVYNPKFQKWVQNTLQVSTRLSLSRLEYKVGIYRYLCHSMTAIYTHICFLWPLSLMPFKSLIPNEVLLYVIWKDTVNRTYALSITIDMSPGRFPEYV